MRKYSKVIMTETGRELLLNEAEVYTSDNSTQYVWDDIYVLEEAWSEEEPVWFFEIDEEEDSEPTTATTRPFALIDEDGSTVYSSDREAGFWL